LWSNGGPKFGRAAHLWRQNTNKPADQLAAGTQYVLDADVLIDARMAHFYSLHNSAAATGAGDVGNVSREYPH